jgi:restriction endonuclease Mrr
MFISFSKFSPGAKEYANKHNIILIDGDDLISRKENNGSKRKDN